MSLTRRHVVFPLLIVAGLLLSWWMLRDRSPSEKHPATANEPSAPTRLDQTEPKPQTATAHSAGDTEITQPPATTPVDSTPTLLAKIEAALRSQTEVDWDQVANVLFPALFAQDRTAAVHLVESFAPGEKRTQLLRRLAQAWAASDFAGAVAWIANLTDFTEQKTAFYDACNAAAESNPAEAVHAWESFDFKDDDHVMENLVQSWAGKDLTAAQAWVSARPSSIQRDQAMARIAYVMAQTNPTAAAALITREIVPGPAQTEATISILHQWARVDLAGATTWVAQFPPGPLAERARSELAGMIR